MPIFFQNFNCFGCFEGSKRQSFSPRLHLSNCNRESFRTEYEGYTKKRTVRRCKMPESFDSWASTFGLITAIAHSHAVASAENFLKKILSLWLSQQSRFWLVSFFPMRKMKVPEEEKARSSDYQFQAFPCAQCFSLPFSALCTEDKPGMNLGRETVALKQLIRPALWVKHVCRCCWRRGCVSPRQEESWRALPCHTQLPPRPCPQGSGTSFPEWAGAPTGGEAQALIPLSGSTCDRCRRSLIRAFSPVGDTRGACCPFCCLWLEVKIQMRHVKIR